MQLSAVAVLLDLAVKGHELAWFEAVAQIGAVEPGTLQTASALTGRHLKNWHAPGSEQARSPYFGDDRGHLSRPQLGNPTRIDAVFVAERQVVQQVVDGMNAFG